MSTCSWQQKKGTGQFSKVQGKVCNSFEEKTLKADKLCKNSGFLNQMNRIQAYENCASKGCTEYGRHYAPLQKRGNNSKAKHNHYIIGW